MPPTGAYRADIFRAKRTNYPPSNRTSQEPLGATRAYFWSRGGTLTIPSEKVKTTQKSIGKKKGIQSAMVLITRPRFFWLHFSYYCFGIGKHGAEFFIKIMFQFDSLHRMNRLTVFPLSMSITNSFPSLYAPPTQ